MQYSLDPQSLPQTGPRSVQRLLYGAGAWQTYTLTDTSRHGNIGRNRSRLMHSVRPQYLALFKYPHSPGTSYTEQTPSDTWTKRLDRSREAGDGWVTVVTANGKTTAARAIYCTSWHNAAKQACRPVVTHNQYDTSPSHLWPTPLHSIHLRCFPSPLGSVSTVGAAACGLGRAVKRWALHRSNDWCRTARIPSDFRLLEIVGRRLGYQRLMNPIRWMDQHRDKRLCDKKVDEYQNCTQPSHGQLHREQ